MSFNWSLMDDMTREQALSHVANMSEQDREQVRQEAAREIEMAQNAMWSWVDVYTDILSKLGSMGQNHSSLYFNLWSRLTANYDQTPTGGEQVWDLDTATRMAHAAIFALAQGALENATVKDGNRRDRRRRK